MTEPLVPGDPVEASTRAQYGAWMHHGLSASEGLVSPSSTPDWPDPPTDAVAWSPWPSGDVAPDRLDEALNRGWLVTVAGRDDPGVPIAVKDIIDVAGLPTHNGTPGGLWREPAVSAPAWESVRTAGARCVGKAATHEMAWGIITPQIANPRAADRITGGSSGGSAACVASGAAVGALGTDTGGSVRVPAALCGVVGFRPTTGTVPSDGVTPICPEQDVVGALAPGVTTCVAMVERMLAKPLTPPRAGLDGMRIGVLARVGSLDEAVQRAYDESLRDLERAGATLVECETKLHRMSASVSLLTMLRSSALQHAEAVRAAPLSFGGEARALLTLGESLAAYGELIDSMRRAVAAETAALYVRDGLDAFVTPTTPCVAPRRGAESVEFGGRSEPVSAALVRYTGWAPVTAMPAISVPVGTATLPAGIQIMAPPHHDATSVRVALALRGSAAAEFGA
ncbi:MAG TPA: amidase [Nocardioidaceae bacterium]|nr:amidase [Nocardioidaceae bacterium]